MNPDTAKIIDRLVMSRDGLQKAGHRRLRRGSRGAGGNG